MHRHNASAYNGIKISTFTGMICSFPARARTHNEERHAHMFMHQPELRLRKKQGTTPWIATKKDEYARRYNSFGSTPAAAIDASVYNTKYHNASVVRGQTQHFQRCSRQKLRRYTHKIPPLSYRQTRGKKQLSSPARRTTFFDIYYTNKRQKRHARTLFW